MHSAILAEYGSGPVIGWDIGGANLKGARLDAGGITVVQQPFHVWERREELVAAIGALARQLGPATAVGVTITAELSDAFRTKREGISFVLDALRQVHDVASLRIFAVDGSFYSLDEAYARPLQVAAANWMATALLVARRIPACTLVDIGSTTTDVVPIGGGQVMARGRTDPERLLRGELRYTGMLRTTVAAIVQYVPLWGGWCPVSAEHFATVQDVHVLLGNLSEAQCSSATADSRPPAAAFAAERLARLVCADCEMLRHEEILTIARCVAAEQLRQIVESITLVRSAGAATGPLVAAGVGSFLVAAAARQLDLPCTLLADYLGPAANDCAPAAAVALLLAEQLSG